MKTKRRLLLSGIVIGSLLTLSPVFGLLGSLFGITRAFHTLGSSGISNPQALSESVGATLLSTATGLFLFPVGIVLLAVSLIFFFRLRPSDPPRLPSDTSDNALIH